MQHRYTVKCYIHLYHISFYSGSTTLWARISAGRRSKEKYGNNLQDVSAIKSKIIKGIKIGKTFFLLLNWPN